MKKSLLVFLLTCFFLYRATPVKAEEATMPWWQFQSIDTMKFSRDPSREFLHRSDTDQIIAEQVGQIAETGVTHIAIATPYDDEFLPILQRWVTAARSHHLKIWFRGNWSGWEGWFGYPKISRQTHLEKTKAFIMAHPDLFEDGDVFSACPECENGGPGDPRQNGDVEGHKQFLIDEYQVTKAAFAKLHKNVASNYLSMNGDVALLIMDRETTTAVDGVVTVDHYVRDPEKLVQDLVSLAQQSGGRIVLGEVGAPIPDIHGAMTDQEQAEWLKTLLSLLAMRQEIMGINYWTNRGGSTALWDDQGRARPAVAELERFFKAPYLMGEVMKNTQPLEGVVVKSHEKQVVTDAQGIYRLPYLQSEGNVIFQHSDQENIKSWKELKQDPNVSFHDQSVFPLQLNVFERIISWFQKVISLRWIAHR